MFALEKADLPMTCSDAVFASHQELLCVRSDLSRRSSKGCALLVGKCQTRDSHKQA